MAFLYHRGWKGEIGVMNLATKKVSFIKPARRATATWLEWGSDKRLVYSIVEKEEMAPKSGPYSLGGLYAVNRDGSKPLELVPSVYRQISAAKNLPNRRGTGAFFGNSVPRFLHALPDEPDHVLVSFTKFNPERRSRRHWLLNFRENLGVYRLNVHSGARTLAEAAFAQVQDWGTDLDGNVRLATAVESNRVVHYHRISSSWQITDPDFDVLGFDPAGEKMYVITDRDRDMSALYAFDTGRKELGPPLLALDDFDLSTASLRFDPVTRQLVGVEYYTDKAQFHAVDPQAGTTQKLLQQALPDLEPTIVCQSRDGRVAIVEASSDRRPSLYFLFERDTKKLTLVGSSRPWLKTAELSPMRPVTFKARDGFTVRGYLTVPAAAAGEKPPLVVLPHGGPWLRDYWGFDSEVQFLASRGYAVLQVNFRGSTGYGRKFLEAGYKEWGATMQDDVTDGVKWAIAEGLVDPNRIGIYGASYGGFAAMAGLCFTPELYRCGINMCGVTDLRTFLDSIPGEKKLLRANMERLVGDPKEDAELLKRRSPQHNIERIQVPVLLAYGQEDSIVEINQGDRFHRELKRNGKEVRYLVFPDEGHGFYRRENRLKYYAEVESFLEKHLKSPKP